jgi:hypothetical protein
MSSVRNLCSGIRTQKQPLNVLLDQLAEGRDSRGIEVRNNAPHWHLQHKLAQHFELGGALSPVQQPIHVRILYQFEKRLPSADFFNARSIVSRNSRGKDVNAAKRSALTFEFCVLAPQL